VRPARAPAAAPKPVRALSAALPAAVHILGLAAFLYPFFLHDIVRQTENNSHATDAPVFFALFGVLLVAIAATELRAGRLEPKELALLGVLSGINAMLRVPGSLAGANLMFFLPIVAGYAFGARFGFLLGACSMAAAGAVTGGIGPWLPFQMWVLGWTGAGGAAVRALTRGRTGRTTLFALAAYGWIAGIAFGILLNLWFWPFLGGASEVSWWPGLSAGQALVHYWRFYVATSLAWDSARALMNVALILTLGRPALRLLTKFRARLHVTWTGPAEERAVA
jgi:energy-coupling factor transport system substrate-specific component